MSPRLKTLRKVLNPPIIKGFKPYGPEVGKNNAEAVFLLFEEYEAIRLCDYDMLTHHQASEFMGVSRPTFTRIYASARQKIAKSMVEGRQITIEGGKVYFDSDWYKCEKCKSNFNNPEREKPITTCPLCGSDKVKSIDVDNSIDDKCARESNHICFCPECGFEQNHIQGVPCKMQICPKCNNSLHRKSNVIC
jgi:uncharacterized protein